MWLCSAQLVRNNVSIGQLDDVLFYDNETFAIFVLERNQTFWHLSDKISVLWPLSINGAQFGNDNSIGDLPGKRGTVCHVMYQLFTCRKSRPINWINVKNVMLVVCLQ